MLPRILDHLAVFKVYYLIAGIFAVLFSLVLLYDYRRDDRDRRISAWPTANALITESRVTETATGDEAGVRSQIKVSLDLRFLGPEKEELSSLFDEFLRIDDRDFQTIFAPGKKIVIHYDPEDPSDVHLAPGALRRNSD